MWKPAERLQMTNEQRATLEAWVRAKTSPQRTVLRARICLLAAQGLPNRVIANTLKTSRPTVVQWRQRFEERGSFLRRKESFKMSQPCCQILTVTVI